MKKTTKSQKENWKISDLIDLEYFLNRYENASDSDEINQLTAEDRDIYLKTIAPALPDSPPASNTLIIKKWLEQRRKSEMADATASPVLPGTAFNEIYRLIFLLLGIFGLFTGGTLAFSFINYKGAEPLNVSLYFGGFVLLQMMIVLFLLLTVGFRSLNRSLLKSSMLYSFFSLMLIKLAGKLKKTLRNQLTGEKKQALEAVSGLIRGRQKIYGSLFYWPFFSLAQVFGICFNIGVLGATLMEVVSSDVAFGWQSTIQFSSEAVYRMVETIALPWSWFVPPEIACPSLQEIEGSHMVLKDGIYHLATHDLVSWWPFLCLSVLFYGLIPRLLLYGGGEAVQRFLLNRLTFTHSACSRLLHRLQTPAVTTSGDRASSERPEEPSPPPVDDSKESGSEPVPQQSVIALIPDELFDACSNGHFEKVMKRVLQAEMQSAIRLEDDLETDPSRLADLLLPHQADSPSVLLLQEAWQPPIREILLFIQNLRNMIGETVPVCVGLIGRPEPESIFTPVDDSDWRVWRQKIHSLGDPYIHIERLVS